MKTTIRELKRNGYKKTTVNGLYLTNNGKAYNTVTNNYLTHSKRGSVTVNGKQYNLAKLILETYKKTPVRTGGIVFLNGNDQDFSFKNLMYSSTGIHYTAPPESEMIKAIRLYFPVVNNFTVNHIFFKSYLNQIAVKRGFIDLHANKEYFLFLEWIEPLSQSKANTSKKHGYTVRNGTNFINKYLSLLVNDCLQDYENGLLQIMDFAPKPLTQTEKNIKINESAKIAGLEARVPLRKQSTKELIAGFNALKIGLQNIDK